MTENEPARPRTEVVEETEETLEVLTLRRTPRAEKMAREQQLLENAHEVRFGEREWRPQRDAGIDDVRAAVDALETKPVAFPEPAPPAAEPFPPEPEPAAPEPETAEIPEDLRAALTPIVPGALRSVDVLHREGDRRVVEVAYETPDGRGTRGIYVVTGDDARPFDDIAAHIDALPTPTIPDTPSPPEPSDAEPMADAEPEPAGTPEEGAAAEADETPKKKGLLGRFGRKAQARSEPEAEATPPTDADADANPDADADAAPAAKKGLLGRFGKKAKSEEPATPADAESADASPPAKKRFGLRRK